MINLVYRLIIIVFFINPVFGLINIVFRLFKVTMIIE